MFTIDTKKLKDVLSLAALTIDRYNSMPILNNILIELNDETLTFKSTDLETWFSSTVEIIDCLHENSKIVIDCRDFLKVITNEKNKTLDLFIDDVDKKLIIRNSNIEYSLPGIDPDEYPVESFGIDAPICTIATEDLKALIDGTIKAVSIDETRYHLNGCYFEILENNGYSMTSTDGHRLHHKTIKSKNDFNCNIGMGYILNTKSLKLLLSAIKKQSKETIVISISGSFMIMHLNERTQITVRLIEGKYPNYKQLIPQKLKYSFDFDREHLLGILKNILPLTRKKHYGATFEFTKNKLTISNKNEFNEFSQDIVTDTFFNLKIGFNIKYLIDALSSMASDRITMSLNDELSPITLNQDSDLVCVVMPMRV